MKKTLMLLAAALTAGVAFAEVFTWKTSAERVNDWNWCEAGNFVGGKAPSGAAVVVIPAGDKITLKASDSGSVAVANALTRIGLADSQSALEVEVASGEMRLNPEVGYAGTDGTVSANGDGRLFKTGGGTLVLVATSLTSYYLNINVVEGELKMPHGAAQSTKYLATLSVSNGAAFFVSTNNVYVQCWSLRGPGTVTSEREGSVLRIAGGTASKPNVCDTYITSKVYQYVSGYVRFTCPSNEFYYCYTMSNKDKLLEGDGVCEFPEVADWNLPSCLGRKTTLIYSTDGGIFRYCGLKDAIMGQRFEVGFPKTALVGFDAGPHGGITFTNYLTTTTSSDNSRFGACAFYLLGSNTVPCVIKGAILTPERSGYPAAISFVKSGSGTWRFADHATRGNKGGLAVDEGTIQFDSIAEVGETCSLGTAERCYPRGYYGAINGVATVDYAFTLGYGGKTGTLEYTGTNTVRQLTRSAAFAGDGRLVNSAAANGGASRRYFAWFAGARSIASGLHHLILDGTSANGADEVANLDDGAEGRLGVIKRGSGTWRLSGTNTFSGPIEVEAGKLVLVTPHYTWFKLTLTGIKALDYSAYANKKEIELHELAFFDKDGYRQNIGLKRTEDSYARLYGTHPTTRFRDVLLPGECTYAETVFFDTAVNGWYWGRNSHEIDMLFDHSTSNDWAFQRYLPNSQGATSLNEYPLPIMFRLPEGAKPVTTYDIVTMRDSVGNLSSYVMNPKCWTLQGSVDGKTWVTLHTMADAGADGQTLQLHGAKRWMSSNVLFSEADGVTVPHTTGQSFDVAPGGTIGTSFNRVEYASVASGATLVAEGDITLKGLKVDYAKGAGTLTGFSFADSGTLTVENLPNEMSVQLPGTYDQKLANWTLASSDPHIARRRMSMDAEGHIFIRKNGVIIFVR